MSVHYSVVAFQHVLRSSVTNNREDIPVLPTFTVH
jgi:hypothetical protein